MEINGGSLSVKLGPSDKIVIEGYDGGTVTVHGLACGGVEVNSSAILLNSHKARVWSDPEKQAVVSLTLTRDPEFYATLLGKG